MDSADLRVNVSSTTTAVATPGAGLAFRDLRCERGGRAIFDRLSAQVTPSQLLRVQGANGAGKTSLLRTLCGLLPPAGGEVTWGGRTIETLGEEFKRQLVYLGHAAALKDDLTAIENLQVATALSAITAQNSEVVAALTQAGLRGRERLPVRVLSQGQRRRVALARLALSAAAALWILDEPFNALDTAASAWLLGLIKAQLGRGGIVVLTSHQAIAFGMDVDLVELHL